MRGGISVQLVSVASGDVVVLPTELRDIQVCVNHVTGGCPREGRHLVLGASLGEWIHSLTAAFHLHVGALAVSLGVFHPSGDGDLVAGARQRPGRLTAVDRYAVKRCSGHTSPWSLQIRNPPDSQTSCLRLPIRHWHLLPHA